ncbi:ATP-binding cassette domain-containing protein [Lachnospiraceae bacterium 54-53]
MYLKVNGIYYQYDKRDLILEDINLQAKRGEICSIQGDNGCGKTTLLKLIAGLLTPDKGTIMYKNNNADTMSYKEVMAYIPTEPYIFDMLTGTEHALLCVDLWSMHDFKSRYLDYFYMLCEELHILEHLPKKLCECSYGTKYKIYLATMFARRPELVIMDEPFTSMDTESRMFMIHYLKELSKDIIVIFTSHQQNTINQLSNYKYIIKNRKLTIKEGENL